MIAISMIYSYVEKYRCVIDTAIYTAVSKVRTFDNFSAKLKRNSKQFQNVNYCSSSDGVSWGGGGNSGENLVKLFINMISVNKNLGRATNPPCPTEQKWVKHKMIFF